MNIIKAKEYMDMSRKAANIISAQIIMKPNCVLGLATGSSPLQIYRQLIEWYKKDDLDFSKVRSINLDEYKGLKAESEQSYHYFMKHNFFDFINIDQNNTYIPNGMENNVAKACDDHNNIIKKLGGIDLQLLGIGLNGHIGFNEPGVSFEKETHCINLTQSTINANSRFFPNRQSMPTQAYTMGIKSIMMAKKILVVASGENKADIVAAAFAGPVTPSVPASILQMHPDVTLVADKAALTYLLNY